MKQSPRATNGRPYTNKPTHLNVGASIARPQKDELHHRHSVGIRFPKAPLPKGGWQQEQSKC